VADIKGKRAAADALLATVTKTLLTKKAKRTTKKVGEATLVVFELSPASADKPAEMAVYCLHADTLVAADQEAVAAAIVARIGAKAKDALAGADAFRVVTDKTKPDKDAAGGSLRWFLKPLGYAETSRAAQGGRKGRGKDRNKLFRQQGFDAVQGVGGCVQLHTPSHEILHRTYAYAPPVQAAKEGEKYVGAANLLDFPNTPNLDVQTWVPNDLSSYLTFNLAPEKAFRHFGGLYDGYGETVGGWEETLYGLKMGDGGPAIDVTKEIIAQFSGRVTLIAAYREPITPHSERLLVALELNPGKAPQASVRAGIDKIVARRDARKIVVADEAGWELLEELAAEDVGKKKPKPEGAVVVVQGHLFFASHADYLADALQAHKPADQLANASDLKLVRDDLIKLGSGKDSFRFFTRTDESWRMNYELIGKGAMGAVNLASPR
jgi:hypothetical protein